MVSTDTISICDYIVFRHVQITHFLYQAVVRAMKQSLTFSRFLLEIPSSGIELHVCFCRPCSLQ
jgi:hypothetical protein